MHELLLFIIIQCNYLQQKSVSSEMKRVTM